MRGDVPTAVMLTAVAVALIGGYVVLALTGRDTVAYLGFVGGPAFTAGVGALLSRRTAAIASDVAVVKHQTNGLLSAQFNAAASDRHDIADAAIAAIDQRDVDAGAASGEGLPPAGAGAPAGL